MGISGSLVGQYERGVVNPKYETIIRFADALNVEPREILGNAFIDVVGPETRRACHESGVVGVKLYDSGRIERITTSEQLNEAYSKLNSEGQKVAVERIKELTQIPKYQSERVHCGHTETPPGGADDKDPDKK